MTIRSRPYLLNLLLLCLSLALSVAVGSVYIPFPTLVRILTAQFTPLAHQPGLVETLSAIVFKIRLPHAALIALTGAALGGSGAAYQGLFRNPLADPYLIGVASGAGLGAVIGMAAHWPQSLLGFYSIPAAAFLGAALTILIVYNLARVGPTIPTTTLILAGVAVSAFATSLTSFLMMRSREEVHRALSWLLGGSSIGGWEPVLATVPYIAAGLAVLILSGHALNLLQFGEEQAQQLGLHVDRTKTILIVATSLATAAAVSFSGLIGFIGLIVPHLVRMLWGPDYKHLVPLSILGGSSLLLLADLLARVILAPQILPVGIVTALAGAPFFLWIMRRAKLQAYW
jgi:iron complex transport system permease protein